MESSTPYPYTLILYSKRWLDMGRDFRCPEAFHGLKTSYKLRLRVNMEDASRSVFTLYIDPSLKKDLSNMVKAVRRVAEACLR